MRPIIEQGEILSDFEKDELAEYKKDIKVKLSLTIPFTLALVIYYYFPNEYRNVIVLVAIINITIHFLFIYLNQYLYRLKHFILSRYLFGEFYLIQFLLMTNIFLYLNPIWSDYFILVSFFILIITIYIGKEFSDSLKFNNFVQIFPFKTINGIYVFDAFNHNKTRKISKNKKIIIHTLSLLIPFIILGLEWVINFFKIEISYRYLIVLPLILTAIFIILTVKIFSYLYFITKYEKEQNTILYTRLFEYNLLEDDINQWRKSWKSLGPIKINSIFFNGDVNK